MFGPSSRLTYLCLTMKRYTLIITILFYCLLVRAQEVRSGISSVTSAQKPISSAVTPAHDIIAPTINKVSIDSLHLPALNTNGQVQPFHLSPLYWGGWYNWNLHRGLNINLGASVFAQFGKNAHHGAGFTQSISAMYAMPITSKLSFAVGGYFNNIYWAHDSFRDTGLSAVLGYRFNEHWEAYLYGQKSLVDNQRIPYPLYDMQSLGDRIGTAVKYNFNPNFSIQLSVEQGWMPRRDSQYFDKYNYPIPEK